MAVSMEQQRWLAIILSCVGPLLYSVVGICTSVEQGNKSGHVDARGQHPRKQTAHTRAISAPDQCFSKNVCVSRQLAALLREAQGSERVFSCNCEAWCDMLPAAPSVYGRGLCQGSVEPHNSGVHPLPTRVLTQLCSEASETVGCAHVTA